MQQESAPGFTSEITSRKRAKKKRRGEGAIKTKTTHKKKKGRKIDRK